MEWCVSDPFIEVREPSQTRDTSQALFMYITTNNIKERALAGCHNNSKQWKSDTAVAQRQKTARISLLRGYQSSKKRDSVHHHHHLLSIPEAQSGD